MEDTHMIFQNMDSISVGESDQAYDIYRTRHLATYIIYHYTACNDSSLLALEVCRTRVTFETNKWLCSITGWSVTKGVELLMGNWLESLDLRLAFFHCHMPLKLQLDTLK